MRRLIPKFVPIADILLLPFVYPAAWLLKGIRKIGVHRLTRCKNALLNIGVFPILNQYYEPQFDNRNPKLDFSADRDLRGIDWNIAGQLSLLERFGFTAELKDISEEKPSILKFYLNNGTFESGDAEYWYQLIRTIKPSKVFEIGSGNSTLMAIRAINRNMDESSSYKCEHICIEPYEMPWLEEVRVSVLRKKVEDMELFFFTIAEE